MKKIIVAIPHSHTWLWTQTCVSSLLRNPPVAKGYEVEIVVVDNSPWSPAIMGLQIPTYNKRGLLENVFSKFDPPINFNIGANYKSNKFHASALDCVVELMDFDLLMALETDVMVLRPTWLQWFVDQLETSDFAVGMWHHEQFINPSCTLYRGQTLRDMLEWCQGKEDHILNWRSGKYITCPVPETNLRWGPNFEKSQPVKDRNPEHDYRGWYDDNISWIAGPFAEKRGFIEGTVLKEPPSGQMKGPGWYEPGQQLHAWAVQAGWTYTVCPTLTTVDATNCPLQTLYGPRIPEPYRQLEASEMLGNAETAHLWGGTRALDILKHDVTCQFVKQRTPEWLAREARFWKATVPEEIQNLTIDLIREYGWHITGQGTDHVTQRDRDAAEFVKKCYAAGGVTY